MYRVRYYDQQYHPAVFTGARGRFIRVLNWVRWKLETYIQFQVLKYLARDRQLPQSEVGALTRMFRLDVEAESLERKATDPTKPLLKEVSPPRSSKYTLGSFGDVAEDLPEGETKPLRPVPLDEMAARYASNDRTKRYANGRDRKSSLIEDEFEPVEEDS